MGAPLDSIEEYSPLDNTWRWVVQHADACCLSQEPGHRGRLRPGDLLLDLRADAPLAADLRAVVRAAPMFHPVTRWGKEMSVNDIAERVGLSQSALSQHLAKPTSTRGSRSTQLPSLWPEMGRGTPQWAAVH